MDLDINLDTIMSTIGVNVDRVSSLKNNSKMDLFAPRSNNYYVLLSHYIPGVIFESLVQFPE